MTFAKLSAQHSSVLSLLAKGLSNVAISTELGLSPLRVSVCIRQMAEARHWNTGNFRVRLAMLATEAPPSFKLPTIRLSPNQATVSRLVMHGLTDKEIAARLGTTLRAARQRMEKVMAKCGVCSRLQLALYVKQHGGEEWLKAATKARHDTPSFGHVFNADCGRCEWCDVMDGESEAHKPCGDRQRTFILRTQSAA